MIFLPGFLFAAALLVGGALAVRAISQAFHDHLVVVQSLLIYAFVSTSCHMPILPIKKAIQTIACGAGKHLDRPVCLVFTHLHIGP